MSWITAAFWRASDVSFSSSTDVSVLSHQSMKALQYLSMASMVTYLCIHVIVYLCNCICCKCISPKHGQHWYVSFQSASKRCKNVGGACFSFLAHSAASEEKKSHNIWKSYTGHNCMGRNTNTQKYVENVNTELEQIQIQKHKYKNTNTKTQIQKHKYKTQIHK